MVFQPLILLVAIATYSPVLAAAVPPEILTRPISHHGTNISSLEKLAVSESIYTVHEKERDISITAEETFRTGGSTNAVQEKIRWVTRDQITLLTELVPGGSEGGITQYVARGRVPSTYTEWVPGKAISTNNGKFIIYSPFDGKEYDFWFSYQLLIASPGATSWVTASSMPSNAIIAGNDPRNLDLTRICRGVYDNKLMIGKTFTDPRRCAIPYRGREHNTWASVQVLVAN